MYEAKQFQREKTMPISGPRKLYKIADIQVGEDAAGSGGRPIIAKIKEPIGDFLGLTPLAWNDPELVGTFGGTAGNQGFKYIRRLGGFRHSSFKLVAKTQFTITEIVRDDQGDYSTTTNKYKSMSIGFPKGVSVHEFVSWIGGNSKLSEISYIVTPAGVSFSLGPVTT